MLKNQKLERKCFIDNTIPPLSKSEISSLYARFVSDMIGNPEDRFSNDAAHSILLSECLEQLS